MMRREVQQLYAGQGDFRLTPGWRKRFFLRHRIVMRRRNNVKCKSIEARLPGIRQWHRNYLAMVTDEAGRRLRPHQPIDRVHGRFAPSMVFNFDEIPLAFVQYQNKTYEFKGTKFVPIRCPGDASGSKRFCTLVPLIAGDGRLFRPALIFKGTGARIKAEERAAYSKDVTVLFQSKAW